MKAIKTLIYRARIGRLLSAEINPHPLFFLLILLLAKFDLLNITRFAIYLLGMGTVFFLARGYNYFFYCSPIVGAGFLYVSWPFGLLGVLWANQIWKMYLFLFLLAYKFTMFDKDFQNIYEITFSIFILAKTYQGMIFESVRDNLYFFTGFFSLASISLF